MAAGKPLDDNEAGARQYTLHSLGEAALAARSMLKRLRSRFEAAAEVSASYVNSDSAVIKQVSHMTSSLRLLSWTVHSKASE